MQPTSRLKESFVAGVILVAPLAVSLYILQILVSWSLQFVNPIVGRLGLIETAANIELAAQVMAVVLVVLVVMVITLLGSRPSGRWAITCLATSAGRSTSSRS